MTICVCPKCGMVVGMLEPCRCDEESSPVPTSRMALGRSWKALREELLADPDFVREYLEVYQKENAALRAQVAKLREAMIDRRSRRPQCRGCYMYLDVTGHGDEHTPDCWAKKALSSPVPSE